MQDSVRNAVAEFVGTFGLVFIGSGAMILAKMPNSNIGLIEVAMAHGLILAIMVTATMRISGGLLNPALTLGLLATGRMSATKTVQYIVAQVLGAIVAGFLLRACIPHALYAAAQGGSLSIASDVSAGQAFGLEAIATFFLMFAVFGTAVDPRAPKVGGFAIGLTIAADLLVIGPLTGGAINPARGLGPAVASGNYVGQLIYWLGPIAGAVVAALVYDRVLMAKEPAAT